MKAMVLDKVAALKDNPNPLTLKDVLEPDPGSGEVFLRVVACGVCHTELDEIEGRTPPPRLPVILGHQIVGRVERVGPDVQRLKVDDRVGVGWIFDSCGQCQLCLSGNDNLCNDFTATGRDVNGGYAEGMTVPESSAFFIPDAFSDSEAAPLLCAGAIGYRSLNLTHLKDGQNLGLTGFGASGHLVLKMVQHTLPNAKTFVFARNPEERLFALDLGAVWAGDTTDTSPEGLHAIIDTTPVWKPVVEALRNLESGGRLIINAIRKEEIDKDYLLQLDYPTHLWMEKEVKSVANVARSDISGFLALAAEIPIRPEIQEYALQDANRALTELKEGNIRGAKILRVE